MPRLPLSDFGPRLYNIGAPGGRAAFQGAGPLPGRLLPHQQLGAVIESGRRATAADFGGDVAAATRELGATILHAGEQAQATREQNEARRVVVETQKAQAEFIQEYANAARGGTDFDAVRQKLDDRLAGIRGGLTTEKALYAADLHAEQTREQFARYHEQLANQRYGRQMQNDVAESLAAASAVLQQDDSDNSVYFQRGLVGEVINQFEGRVPPEVLEAARREANSRLDAAIANAWIERDPSAALEALRTGKLEHLTPEQRTATINVAQQAIRSAEAERRAADAAMQKAKDAVAEAVFNEIQIAHANGELAKFNWRNMLRRQDLSPEQRDKLLRIYESYVRDEKKDPTPANEAYKNIFRPEGDPRRISSAEEIDTLLIRGKIDANQHAGLRNALKARDKPEIQIENVFLDKMDALINPRDMLGRILNPDGPINSYNFRREVEKQRKAAIADKRDPANLFDPSHGDFRRHIVPLIEKYRAQTTLSTNDKGQTTAVPMPAPSIIESPTAEKPPPKVKDIFDYYALPPGTKFIDPKGQLRWKPKASDAQR